MKEKIECKEGVTLDGLDPIMLLALFQIKRFLDYAKIPLVVTSTTEGAHMEGSLHYVGLAIDIRHRFIPSFQRAGIANDLRTFLRSLDRRFQVILEDSHIHIEFDRRVC